MRKLHSELSAEAKGKAIIRAKAGVYQRRGRLIKGPCEVCGTTVGIEKHHPDYRFPLCVMWLCRPHHLALEAELRRADRIIAGRARLKSLNKGGD